MKTIHKLLLIMIFILATSIKINAQYIWANQIGSDSWDYPRCVVVDNSNNLYVGGSFQGVNCYFNSDTLGVYGFNQMFLVKYDNNGNEIWIKTFGGNNTPSNYEGIAGICYDEANNFIYITGAFSGSATFGSTTLTTTAQTAFFLAKLDLNGNCIWAKQNTGSGETVGSGVAIDNIGNIYVCGENTLSATFDTSTIAGGAFIAKYDMSGNCLLAKNKFRLANPAWLGSEATPWGIKIFNSNILIAGNAGNDTIVVDTITAISSSNNAFIASFNLSGDVQWLKRMGGGSGLDFSIDNVGNSYISGIFIGTGYFGTTTLTNGTQDDAFLAKYDINGNMKWVKQLNASGGAWGKNGSTNSDGNTYMTGYFSGNASFGPYSITASTTQDMFVARYDSTGICLGVQNFGQAEGSGVFAKDNNEFWLTGAFNNSISIGTNNFTAYGQRDVFVTKSDAITGINTNHTMTNNSQLLIYANPNKGTCNITVPEDFLNQKNLVLTIYDNMGKAIQRIPVETSQEKIKINLEAEAKGIYNVTLSNGTKIYSGKIVFE